MERLDGNQIKPMSVEDERTVHKVPTTIKVQTVTQVHAATKEGIFVVLKLMLDVALDDCKYLKVIQVVQSWERRLFWGFFEMESKSF